MAGIRSPDSPGPDIGRVPVSLTHFGLAEMLRWGFDLPRRIAAASTFEEAAQALARHIYDDALSPAGARECALVRVYATHACATLPPDLKAFIDGQMQGECQASDLQCLALLGTAGDEPAWNNRHLSRAHQAIPLPSVRRVERTPMVGQLLRSLGVQTEAVVSPRPEMVRGLAAKSYDVFYVPEAEGSAHIPDQDFVRRYGIQSVIGFGGALSKGGFYTVILFSRARIQESALERFRSLAQDLTDALGEFGPDRVFAPIPAGMA
jgi:hypothetical protein